MARQLKVEIVGDSRDLERAFSRSERAAKKFSRTMTGALAGGVAGVGFAKLAADTVMAASDLQESMSKTSAVFGKSADTIQAWAKTTATAFGVSQRAALETASSFGALFGPLGITGKQAADQSRRLTELGADLASFYNTDVQSALDAIRSGLVGESEPLRRYGALLSETRVQQEAMAQTGKKTAASLTDQEKVLARIALIFEDTNVAQGDFSRTSGSLAGQLKILQAQTSDLQAEIGTLLLPKIIELTTAFNEWLADPENKKKVIDGFTTAVNGLGRAFEFAAGTVGFFVDAYDKLPDFGKEGGALDFDWSDPNKTIRDKAGLSGVVGKVGGGGDFSAGGGPVYRGPSRSGGGTAGTLIAPDALSAPLIAFFARIKAIDTAQKAAAKLKAQMKLRQQRFQAGLENQWGWLQFGGEVAEASGKPAKILANLRKQEAFLQKRIQAAGRTLDLTRKLWAVQEQIRDLNKNKAAAAGFHQVSAAKVAAMLGLGGDQRATMLLAALGKGGTLPTGGAAFGAGRGGMVVNGNVHVHGVTDTRTLQDQIEKQNRGRPAVRRGAK